jgi:hypothetical protein
MSLSDEDQVAIFEWAEKHPAIQEVWLYGSRAKGGSRPDSDIDLAIVMRGTGDADRAYNEWSKWHYEYSQGPDLHLSHRVHLEWYEKGAGLERVGPAVERDGVLLYTSPI